MTSSCIVAWKRSTRPRCTRARSYVARRFLDPFCWVCAQPKAQRRARGLHTHANVTHAKVAFLVEGETKAVFHEFAEHSAPGVRYRAYVLVAEAVEARVVVLDDNDHDDTSSDEDDETKLEMQYLSPMAGRVLGTMHVSRFDIDTLRPFEIMLVDNKDYKQPVRGGRQTTLILYDIDVKSTAKFKVDLFKKTENGTVLCDTLSMNGVHKLPYS